MTPIWGLTAARARRPGATRACCRRRVIYDPVLTLTLPPAIAGPSGMNAIAHCVEALYAEGANPITSLMAEEGIRVLARGLPRVVARPDDLECAQRRPGRRVPRRRSSSRPPAAGIHHKICHVLGGAYDLPHAEMHTVDPAPRARLQWPRACPRRWAGWRRRSGEPDVAGGRSSTWPVGRCAAPASPTIGMPADRLDEAADLIADAARTARSP